AAEGRAIHGAFGAVLAIVPEALDDPAERAAARAEIGLAGVVLEAHQGPPGRVPIARQDDVPDAAPAPGHGPCIEQADPGQFFPAAGPEVLAEQLVAAADREQRGTRLHRPLDRFGLALDQVIGNHGLLAILAAAEEDQVRCLRTELLAERA